MPKKSKSDTTIKTLIYILIFLIIILLLLILLIIPNIKTYKLSKADLKIFTEKNRYLSRQQIELKNSIKKFKKENAFIIKKLDTQFNKDDFIKYASKYLKDVQVSKVDKHIDKSFETYRFTAYTTKKSPKDFFKFVDSLKEYKSLIKINFPISLSSTKDNIKLDFNIGAYKKE